MDSDFALLEYCVAEPEAAFSQEVEAAKKNPL
jgi:hypothetical protein